MESRALLTFYGRNYCHLCDDLLAALEQLRGEFVFEVTVIDVDVDPMLSARFDELVPVLLGNDGLELCHHHLDTPKVREYLSRFR